MTRDDIELGPVRWCAGCEEWWPDDAEFWYRRQIESGTVAVSRGRPYRRRTATEAVMCIACQAERRRARTESRRAYDRARYRAKKDVILEARHAHYREHRGEILAKKAAQYRERSAA